MTKAVKQMTDEQLVNQLRTEFGYKAGPITVTTRSVYEKKLVNFLKSPPSPSRLTPIKKQAVASTSFVPNGEEGELCDFCLFCNMISNSLFISLKQEGLRTLLLEPKEGKASLFPLLQRPEADHSLLRLKNLLRPQTTLRKMSSYNRRNPREE